MLVDFSIPLVITLDVLGWLTIHLGMVYLTKNLPDSWFDHNRRPYKQFGWEKDGAFYERVFKVKRWKESLPDGAVMIRGGFRKKRLGGTSSDYYSRFILETCRGELTHWLGLCP